jgi:hypothetical protein
MAGIIPAEAIADSGTLPGGTHCGCSQAGKPRWAYELLVDIAKTPPAEVSAVYLFLESNEPVELSNEQISVVIGVSEVTRSLVQFLCCSWHSECSRGSSTYLLLLPHEEGLSLWRDPYINKYAEKLLRSHQQPHDGVRTDKNALKRAKKNALGVVAVSSQGMIRIVTFSLPTSFTRLNRTLAFSGASLMQPCDAGLPSRFTYSVPCMAKLPLKKMEYGIGEPS